MLQCLFVCLCVCVCVGVAKRITECFAAVILDAAAVWLSAGCAGLA